ncbi:MAG: AsmA family protein [Syntrophobacteria bacterium]
MIASILMVCAVLLIYDCNDLKPYITRAVREATGRTLSLDGEIDLAIGVPPAVVVEDVHFQNAVWGSRPELMEIRRLEAELKLLPLVFGHIRLERLSLFEPDVLVETDASGRWNLSLGTGRDGEQSRPREERVIDSGILTFDTLHIEKGRLLYKDGRSGRTLGLTVDKLDAQKRESDRLVEVELDGAYQGGPFHLAGTVGPLDVLIDPERAWPVNVTAETAVATLRVNGTIKEPLSRHGTELDFRIQGRDLSRLNRFTHQKTICKGPFLISGHAVDRGPEAYSITGFTFSCGDIDLGGSLELRHPGGKREVLRADLTSEELDLRAPLSGLLKTGEGGDPARKRDRVLPDWPLPLDILKGKDFDVKIQTGRILLPQLSLAGVSVRAVRRDGCLTVKPFKAYFGGGSLDGWLRLRPQGNEAALSVVLKVEQLDLDHVFRNLELKEGLQGKVDMDTYVEGCGGSTRALTAGLDGRIIVSMAGGRISNRYIQMLGAELGSRVLRLLNPLEEEMRHTRINCFVSRFDIEDGLARCGVLFLDTTNTSVAGGGDIDLKTEELNLALKPLPKKGVGIKGIGRLTFSLDELVKPFKLGGTLSHPSLAVDATSTAATVGKAVGGVALFGPFGIAAVLVSGGYSDGNPCRTALRAAWGESEAEEAGKQEKEKELLHKAAEGMKRGVEATGKKIKDLFGN